MRNHDLKEIAKDKEALSDIIKESFEVFQLTFEMLNLSITYEKLAKLLPKNTVMFDKFDIETMIACETVCATICHKINWDFLRKVVYDKTNNNIEWIKPEMLKKIKAEEVEKLLSKYNKPDRIRGVERSKMLRYVGTSVCRNEKGYRDIFFDENMRIKDLDDILKFFKTCKAFISDPESKKMQLLFQSLSDYTGFEKLNQYYMPTIDYHLIRCFLRRGIIRPINQYGKDFISNVSIERKEHTIGAIRNICSDAINTLCWATSLDLKTINRIEWWVGRTICTEGEPDCYLKRKSASWLKSNFNECPFYEHCYAINYNKEYLSIVEPTYKGSSY